MVKAEDEGLAVVDAPTALKGFLFALRLPGYRCRNKQSEDGRWRVSVQLVDPESLPRGSATATRERAVGAKQDTRAGR
jgi:hypothetical protein